jgi:hypothetical protein
MRTRRLALIGITVVLPLVAALPAWACPLGPSYPSCTPSPCMPAYENDYPSPWIPELSAPPQQEIPEAELLPPPATAYETTSLPGAWSVWDLPTGHGVLFPDAQFPGGTSITGASSNVLSGLPAVGAAPGDVLPETLPSATGFSGPPAVGAAPGDVLPESLPLPVGDNAPEPASLVLLGSGAALLLLDQARRQLHR